MRGHGIALLAELVLDNDSLLLGVMILYELLFGISHAILEPVPALQLVLPLCFSNPC